MLSLTKSPLSQIAYKGKIYNVDLAFDTVLLFLQLQQDKSLSDFDKFVQTNKLFFGKQELPDDPKFFQESMKLINDEINSHPYGNYQNNKKESVDNPQQIFDYPKDAGAIYASFYAQYHIDLNKERGKMHWVVFKALFDGLDDNTYFNRIISYRTRDLSEIKDPKEKANIAEIQNYYALDGNSLTEEEREERAFSNNSLTDMFNTLRNTATKGGK